MSILERKIKDSNKTDIKSPKDISKKNLSTPKKVNLCKKYFYINNNKNMNLQHFNNGRILQLIENTNKNGSGDPLEQVDHLLTQLDQTREELNNKKVDCIKSMILNHKKVPEKWIMKSNYKDLLNKAMEDDIVLNYAVLCKDIYKKREGLDQSDDERYSNYMKSLPEEKKFISFINIYSKNYCDSPTKKKVMRDYCLSITKNKKNRIKAKAINDSSLNSYERNSKLYNKVLEDKTSNSFEDSTKDKNILPLINQNNRIDNNNNLNNMNDTKDDLMVTSLYYSGFDNKNENNYNNLSPKKELKLPELPLI
jgi:hypothetical protein